MMKRSTAMLFAAISVLAAVALLVLLLVSYPSQPVACPYNFPPVPLECVRPQIRTEALVVGLVAVAVHLVATVVAALASRSSVWRERHGVVAGLWVAAAATAIVAIAAVISLAVTRWP